MTLEKVKKYIKDNNITWFSDLDDTISDNSTMFYSKIKILLGIKKTLTEKAFEEVINERSINKKFLKIMNHNPDRKIYILSKNRDDFVQYFIQNTKRFFQGYRINIIGGKGGLSTKDKREILPEGAIFIGDIFEYKEFKDYKHFICVETYSLFKKRYKITVKLKNLFIYFMKNIGKR